MKQFRFTRGGVALALALIMILVLVATTIAAQGAGARTVAARQAAGTPAQGTAPASVATQAAATSVATQAAATQAPAAAAKANQGAFITLNPGAGFPLDPFVVSLQGGGPTAASKLSPDCSGFVASSPSVTVDYAGKADVMRAFFYSDGDPVLVIQTPDGKYLCNDDAAPQLQDPQVEMSKPAAGRYNVWVGSSAARDLIPGFLVFTTQPNVNVGTFTVGNLVKRPAIALVQPPHERLAEAVKMLQQAKAALQAANPITPASKPLTVTLTANGDLPLPELTRGITGTRAISNCDGLISALPNYAFNWTGSAKSLEVFFEGNADTTLAVKTPNGVACSDDTDRAGNLNPLAVIANPANGTYLVWVGRIDPTKQVTGRLTVAPGSDLKPAPLPRAR